MDKREALEFIGLKEPLTEEKVVNKCTERHNYFHMLYTNAPNKVIEKIQQQNLEKLNQVKKILLAEIATKKAAFNRQVAEIARDKESQPGLSKEKRLVAYLILHTENKEPETFPVYEGVNFIGRKNKEGEGDNYILIEDDPFVSRTHAFIKAKQFAEQWQFVLYDGDGSKPSVNGVFLNGKETRIRQHCSLAENDTIQIGTTKFVFRVKKDHITLSGELEEVIHTDYIRTIDIK